MEAPKTPAQWYAALGGAFLTALGVLSLTIIGLEFGTVRNLTGDQDFLIWDVSGWSTLMWIGAGALGLLATSRVDAARTYGLLAGIWFTAIAVWGFIDGNDVFSLIIAGTTNNITHAVLGVLGVVAALPSERRQREYGVGEPHEEVREERRLAREPAAAPAPRAGARG